MLRQCFLKQTPCNCSSCARHAGLAAALPLGAEQSEALCIAYLQEQAVQHDIHTTS